MTHVKFVEYVRTPASRQARVKPIPHSVRLAFARLFKHPLRRSWVRPRRERKERPLWGSTGRKSFLPRKWLHEKLEGGNRCPLIMGLAGRCERGHEMSFRLDWLYGFHSLGAVLYPEESSGYVACGHELDQGLDWLGAVTSRQGSP